MARSVNKVILIGNLGQDPEARFTPSGSAVCNVSLATTESWKDRGVWGATRKNRMASLGIFGRLAEIVSEYLNKGSQIYVEGRLQTRKWQDQSGSERYTTEIVVSDMRMLGNKQSGFTQYDKSQPSGGDDTSTSAADKSKGSEKPSSSPDFDDDIPF